MTKKDVLYVGPYRQTDDWGCTSKALLQLLTLQEDLNVVARPVWFNNQRGQGLAQDLEASENNTLQGTHDVVIQHGIPTNLNYNGNFKENIAVLSLDCNISNTEWPTHLNLFDRVICFSRFEEIILLESKVTTPIESFNHPPFFIEARKTSLDYDYTGTKFYTTGSAEPKSGLVETMAAFLSGFSISDEVILIIATSNSDKVSKLAEHIKHSLGIYKDHKRYPNIAIVNTTDPTVMNYLHDISDYFIDLSYNAKVSQAQLAAISYNNHVITTSHIGLGVFNDNYSFRVSHTNEIQLCPERPLDDLYTGEHCWTCPSIRSAQEVMRYAYAHGPNEHDKEMLEKIKSQMFIHPHARIKEILCIQ